MARELYEILKLLKRTRDMSVNEIKLVVSIDDPRSKVCGRVCMCLCVYVLGQVVCGRGGR